jgi:hypothetical protein
MTTFTLRYDEDGLGLDKRIEFDAGNPAQALSIAQGEAEGRWAELSVDGRPLCRLGRTATDVGDYWVIR